MGESSKKHSRKSKLVERTYEDIEDTTAVKLNEPIKKLANNENLQVPPDTIPPIEFSVNIEVEEGEDEWFKEMIERERLEKLGRKREKKKKIIDDKISQVVNEGFESKILTENDLVNITRGQGIICIDSSNKISKETLLYKNYLLLELLLVSPYTPYNGPINYKELSQKLVNIRSHSVYKYYCMLCKKNCMGRYRFMTHLSKHNDGTQLYYTVTKLPEVPTILCTAHPFQYMDDCIVADVGIGNIINIVTDYDTAIKNMVMKWYCSDNKTKVCNGILSYKCYSCDCVFEFYSQFTSHLNEKHSSVKLMITTEVTDDNYFNVVASSVFKPAFKYLTNKPNLPMYKCFRCKKIFDSHDSYKCHYKRINVCAGCGVELPCYLMKTHEGLCNRFLTVFYPKMCPCKQEFFSSKEMTNHQITCKFGRTALVFNCLACNFLATTTVRLLIHQRLEHYARADLLSVAFKVSLCYVCNEKYVGSYSEHYCKKREEIVDCPFCGRIFQSEYFMTIHQKAYPPAECPYCEKYYQVSCALVEHALNEHGIEDVEIKYKCNTCNVILDQPDEGKRLSDGHILGLHENAKEYIFDYKKIYMPKHLTGTYGYHTNIFPANEIQTNTKKPEDIEDLIEKVVIKKSNIISKSYHSQITSNNTRSLLKPPFHRKDNFRDLSKSISQEHNYDITQSSEIYDGTYEIEKSPDSVGESLSTKDMLINAEIKLLVHSRKKSTVKGNNKPDHINVNFDNFDDITEPQYEIKVEKDSKAGIVINNVDVKVEFDNEIVNNNLLDTFSEINDDLIKCEPDAETILVKTQVPVTFAVYSDETKAGCSKDFDYTIKTEINSDDDSNNDKFDKPPAPLYPEEIGLASQNRIVSNLLFETKEEEAEGADSNKSTKRKLIDSTLRSTKFKPNTGNPDVSEINLSESKKSLTLETHNTSETAEESYDTPAESLKTEENCSKPSKNSSKPKRRKRSLNPWRRKKKISKKNFEPFRGFEPQSTELANKIREIVNRSELTEDDDNLSTSTAMESLNTLEELGESSAAETVSMTSDTMSDIKTEADNDKVTVKLEVKEEIYEEYETDLIIFDDANYSNECTTDEKFVEIKPQRNLKDSPSKPKIYYCKKCQFTGHHKGYKDHLQECHLPKRPHKPSSVKKVQLLKYNCIKCNLECDDLRDYLRHLPGHGYLETHCPCCNEGCESVNKLAEHVLRHIKADFKRICFLHLDNKPMELKKFRCCNCKMIVDQEDFFGHWQVHFDRVTVKKQPRDIRTAVMRAEYGNLATSMALEEGVKKELCQCLQLRDPSRECLLCRKVFSRTHDVKRHLIEHLTMDALCNRPTMKSMKCQICHEDFDFTDLYKRHMRDHASLPLYQCQICDKSFSDSSNFGKHKKVHDICEFVCDICRRKFQCKSTLIKHMLLHEKHQTITCEFCLKKFYFPSTYRKHLKQHEKGVPRQSCTLCKTKFFSVKEQLNHEWAEHGLRKTPVDCPLCDQGYRRLTDLKSHLKAAHSLPILNEKNRKVIEDELQRRGMTQAKVELVFNRLRAAKKNSL